MAKSLEQCKAEFGNVHSTKVGDIDIVFRKPRPAEWRLYMSGVTTAKLGENGGALLDAQERLVQDCCLSHTPPELQKIEEEHLNLYLNVGADIARVGNGESVLFAKKPAPASTKR